MAKKTDLCKIYPQFHKPMWITLFHSQKGKIMSQLDLMKLFSQYDGEVSEADFSPEELQEYLAYMQNQNEPLSPKEWKAKYFEFYDDVKDKSLKKQDW